MQKLDDFYQLIEDRFSRQSQLNGIEPEETIEFTGINVGRQRLPIPLRLGLDQYYCVGPSQLPDLICSVVIGQVGKAWYDSRTRFDLQGFSALGIVLLTPRLLGAIHTLHTLNVLWRPNSTAQTPPTIERFEMLPFRYFDRSWRLPATMDDVIDVVDLITESVNQ